MKKRIAELKRKEDEARRKQMMNEHHRLEEMRMKEK
jgi:hypothetical protein